MVARRYRHGGSLAVLACLGLAACPGLTRGSGAAAGDAGLADGGTGDASVDGEAPDGPLLCDFDASPEAGLCSPPLDDVLYAWPNDVVAAAGGYGAVSLVAGGPWTADPSLTISLESSTLGLVNVPTLTTSGTPQTIIFKVPAAEFGQTGTLTAVGRAGNIEVRAIATVFVTNCAPLPKSVGCGAFDCGFQSDGCGGVEPCGSCAAPTPYCYEGSCISTQPPTCSPGLGFDPDAGGCVWCDHCLAVDNACICSTPLTPPPGVITDGGLPPSDAGGTAECNPVQPFVADATHVACPGNQRCDFINPTTTRCSAPAGVGIQDVFCGANTDCAAGYDCIPGATATVWCERYCRFGAGYTDCGTPASTGGSDVGLSFSCRQLSPPAFDGSQEIGVCDL